jgi:hypothetical protein
MKCQIIVFLPLIVIAIGLLYRQMDYDCFINYTDNAIDYNMYPTYNLNTDNGVQNSFSIFQSSLYSNPNAIPASTDPKCKHGCADQPNSMCVKPSTTSPVASPTCDPSAYGGWVFNGNSLLKNSCGV